MSSMNDISKAFRYLISMAIDTVRKIFEKSYPCPCSQTMAPNADISK